MRGVKAIECQTPRLRCENGGTSKALDGGAVKARRTGIAERPSGALAPGATGSRRQLCTVLSERARASDRYLALHRPGFEPREDISFARARSNSADRHV